MTGALSLLLHAHLPFVRHPEHPDFLEEDWFYEALIECYVPLLTVLTRAAEQGQRFQIALSLSAPLLAMLRDPLLIDRACARLGALVELAEHLERRERGGPYEAATRHHARGLRQTWVDLELTWGRDLMPPIQRLAQAGHLELVGTGATHGILPLMATDQTRRASVRAGLAEVARLCGARPRGLWLPECAWSPELDPLLAACGVGWTAVDSHGLMDAAPPAVHGTSRPIWTPSGVAVFGRDALSSSEVWSAEGGYPGDPWYREFYRDVGFDLPYDEVRPFLHRDGVRRGVGLKLHRVTGSVQLGAKAPYVPEAAAARIEVHAEDFIVKRLDHLRRLAEALHPEPHLFAPYDAELFGHWWMEGPDFLGAVIRRSQGRLRLEGPGAYLDRAPVHQEAMPARSTWGAQGALEVWVNPQNDAALLPLRQAEHILVDLVGRLDGLGGTTARALRQAGRELLLAWSSDWPFLITMGTAPTYAAERQTTHLERFHALAQGLQTGRLSLTELAAWEAQDNLLPALDERLWLPDRAR